jgi:predicted O-methyltransferase YrrM
MKNKTYQFLAGIKYYLFSRHGKGYAVHSPFVFNFIRKVLMKIKSNNLFFSIKEKFIQFVEQVNYDDNLSEIGAGSWSKNNRRSLKQLAKTSGTSNKYLALFEGMIKYFEYKRFLELGTCCGITSALFASLNENTEVTTIEANRERYIVAKSFFEHLNLDSIELINGYFNEELLHLIKNQRKYDFIYIDGDHTYDSTMANFKNALQLIDEDGVIVLDDIFWSPGMTKAWHNIVRDDFAVLTIDLYRMGIVFPYRKQAKQHFRIRF